MARHEANGFIGGYGLYAEAQEYESGFRTLRVVYESQSGASVQVWVEGQEPLTALRISPVVTLKG